MREIKRISDEKLSKYTMGQDFLGDGDRYLLMALLGKGGFSEVFKAYDMNCVKDGTLHAPLTNHIYLVEKQDCTKSL